MWSIQMVCVVYSISVFFGRGGALLAGRYYHAMVCISALCQILAQFPFRPVPIDLGTRAHTSTQALLCIPSRGGAQLKVHKEELPAHETQGQHTAGTRRFPFPAPPPGHTLTKTAAATDVAAVTAAVLEALKQSVTAAVAEAMGRY